MSVEQLAELVRAMREAQKRYFRTRSADALEESKRAERAVDEAVARVLSANRPQQAEMFGNGEGYLGGK